MVDPAASRLAALKRAYAQLSTSDRADFSAHVNKFQHDHAAMAPRSCTTNASCSARCLPNLIIVGMARCGTSRLRDELGRYHGVHIGREVEHWHVTNLSAAMKNYAGCERVRSTHRVAAAPWLMITERKPFELPQLLPARADFVLILRDPVERFTSSFFHLVEATRGQVERTRHLAQLEAWACSPTSHVQLPRMRSGQIPEYYDADAERVLRRAMASFGSHLVVGLLEEQELLVARLTSRLHLQNASAGEPVSGYMKGGNGLNGPRNEAQRCESASREGFCTRWEAVRQRAQSLLARQTNFTTLSRLLRATGDFDHLTTTRLRCLWVLTSGDDSACAIPKHIGRERGYGSRAPSRSPAPMAINCSAMLARMPVQTAAAPSNRELNVRASHHELSARPRTSTAGLN